MTISVTVVEHDPMLLLLICDFIQRIEKFTVGGKATSLNALESSLRSSPSPDLVVLEPFLPFNSMAQALSLLHSQEERPEIIVVSRCADSSVIAEAARRGVFDYIIKPFAIERLSQSLVDFAHHLARKALLSEEVCQEKIDRVFRQRTPLQNALFRDPPKNLNRETALCLLEALHRHQRPLSAKELAEKAGVSRSTSWRYLSFLLDEGFVGRHDEPGITGRPLTRYFPLLCRNTRIFFDEKNEQKEA